MTLSYESGLIFPEHGLIRARKVVKQSNHGHVYKFPSIKCGRIVELESGLEHDRAIILEFDPSVIFFQEQPFALELLYEDKIRRIYPDFLIYRDDGSATVEEIKPADKAGTPENKHKFELEKILLEQHGYKFNVVTDVEIRRGLHLENSRYLLKFRRVQVNDLLRAQVVDALRYQEMTGCELLRRVKDLTNDTALSLLAHGVITTDFSIPITPESRFTPTNRHSNLTMQQMRFLSRRCI